MTGFISRRDVISRIGPGMMPLMVGCAYAPADEGGRHGTGAMGEDEVRDLFGRYISALNAHEMDRMTEFVHETVLQNLRPVTRADVVADLKGHIEAVPDFRWRVRDVVVQGDTVAARLFNIGTPAKRWLGVEPTGRTVETLEFAFHKARDGKFYEMNYAMDVAGLQRQLGL